jgi:hypothetical protein
MTSTGEGVTVDLGFRFFRILFTVGKQDIEGVPRTLLGNHDEVRLVLTDLESCFDAVASCVTNLTVTGTVFMFRKGGWAVLKAGYDVAADWRQASQVQVSGLVLQVASCGCSGFVKHPPAHDSKYFIPRTSTNFSPHNCWDFCPSRLLVLPRLSLSA